MIKSRFSWDTTFFNYITKSVISKTFFNNKIIFCSGFTKDAKRNRSPNKSSLRQTVYLVSSTVIWMLISGPTLSRDRYQDTKRVVKLVDVISYVFQILGQSVKVFTNLKLSKFYDY